MSNPSETEGHVIEVIVVVRHGLMTVRGNWKVEELVAAASLRDASRITVVEAVSNVKSFDRMRILGETIPSRALGVVE